MLLVNGRTLAAGSGQPNPADHSALSALHAAESLAAGKASSCGEEGRPGSTELSWDLWENLRQPLSRWTHGRSE